MLMMILRWQWVALVGRYLVTAIFASVYARIWRRASWYPLGVICNAVTLNQVIAVLVFSHLYTPRPPLGVKLIGFFTLVWSLR